jgi:hypothetical protein
MSHAALLVVVMHGFGVFLSESACNGFEEEEQR